MNFTLIGLPLLLLVAGTPIFAVLLISATVALAFFMNIPLNAVHQNLFGSLNFTGLLAVPFFIFAGELMARGTVSLRLVEFVRSFVGGLPGALGVTPSAPPPSLARSRGRAPRPWPRSARS